MGYSPSEKSARFKFFDAKVSRPCPICGMPNSQKSRSSVCRLTVEGPVFCKNVVLSVPAGYKHSQTSANGVWEIYVLSNESQTEAERDAWQKEQARRAEIIAKKEAEFQANCLSPSDRDTEFRKLIAHLDEGAEPICERAMTDLARREVDIDQAWQWGIRSIAKGQDVSGLGLSAGFPAIAKGGRKLHNEEGYLCPAKDHAGRIMGYQIRLHDGGYRWLSTSDSPKDLANREWPITVARPMNDAPNRDTAIGICEGLLKPFIASQKLNQIVIGAAGGNFGRSQETLKRYLMALKAETEFKHIVLYADAGATKNPSVLGEYIKLVSLVKKWGYSIKVLWYGQFDKHDHNDVDEVSLAELAALRVKLISFETYLSFALNEARLEMDRLVGVMGYRSQGQALQDIHYKGDVSTAVGLWRAVRMLQEKIAVSQLSSKFNAELQARIGEAENEQSFSELRQWAKVHGGDYSNDTGLSGLSSKMLKEALARLETFPAKA